MSVSANQLLKFADGCKVGYPVAASTRLYQGTLAFLNASGYLDDDTNSGANRFAGIVIKDTDNGSGSNGDLTAEVWTDKEFELTGSGFAQTSVGLAVYATDNYTLTLVPGSSGVYVGRVTKYVSSTKVFVKLDGAGFPRTSPIVNLTAATLTVTEPLHNNKTITVNRAAGSTLTLPAATGSGMKLRIFTGTTITSNNLIVQVTGDDIMSGVCITAQDGGDTAVIFETAVDSDTITMNGSTKGGIKGDLIELEDVAADTWAVRVTCSATGTEATPFSAAVS